MPSEQESQEAPPSIAALFLVVFDQKIGYKISWQRTLDGISVDGVEYKSLPSGVHNVPQDLIYFSQDGHAGLSAFVRRAAGESNRNARFAAVGICIAPIPGRLGKAWEHAPGLRELAETCLNDLDNPGCLEEYWGTHCGNAAKEVLGTAGIPQQPPSISTELPTNDDKETSRQSHGSGKEPVLPQDHPALSMHDLLDAFGPLVFPLWRAALLRKRVLLLGTPPVQQLCNYVYALSIFASIPATLSEALPEETELHRMKPLFNVGIHDITELQRENEDNSRGWVACSTDDILATKRTLSDVVVKMPGQTAESQEWPTALTNNGQKILATQRDLRRYNALRKELLRLKRQRSWREQYRDEEEEAVAGEDDDEDMPLMRSITSIVLDNPQRDIPELENEASITEAPSWASIAYGSFLWWASAGERSAAREEEADQDASLVDDLIFTTIGHSNPPSPLLHNRRRSGSSAKRWKRSSTTSLGRLMSGASADDQGRRLTAAESQQESTIMIAYFHRLTTLLMSGVADIVSYLDETPTDNDAEPIQLSAEEMSRLGLDMWSDADSKFISELGWRWWGRDMKWSGRGIELCGVRIC